MMKVAAAHCSRRSLLAGMMAGSALSALPPTAGAADVPWLAEVQTPPKSLDKDAPQLSDLLRDDESAEITSRAGWERKRALLLRRWRTFLGELDAKRKGAPRLEVLQSDSIDGVERQRVRYEVEPGIPTEAYLLRPADEASQKRPGVVVFHSTVDSSIQQPAGVKGEAAKAFGLQLAKQGFVTICPRNHLWPQNDGIAAQQQTSRFLKRQPQCLGMAKMLFDGQVALDILAAQADVDGDRLGAVGHSLGAKEVLYLAAFDERVKAAVSSEGGIGIGFSNWHDPWYLGGRVKEPGFNFDHHELLGMIAPRPFLLIGGDSADGDRSWPYIAAALPVYKLYGDEPRLALYNHKQGHSVPKEVVSRIGEWCQAYL